MTPDRVLSDAALTPHPDIVGRRLASPRRRCWAVLVDAILLFVPSIAVTVAAAAFALSASDPGAFQTIRAMAGPELDPSEKTLALGRMAPLLMRIDAPGLPRSVMTAVEEGDLAKAGEILGGYNVNFSIKLDEEEVVPPPQTIQVEVTRLIPWGLRSAAFFGTAALYFTLLTSGRRRSTFGKWLMGIQVLKLDGQPLTLWEAFERFGGYFASAGTFGLGILDLWRDPNRRMPTTGYPARLSSGECRHDVGTSLSSQFGSRRLAGERP